MIPRWFVLPPLMVLLSACASLPTGPTVMVLPGVGKPFDLFQAEEVACRHYAQVQTGTIPEQSATDSTVSGAFLGTLLGAGVGAAIGAATGRPDVGAAVGAGGGLLIGASEGARAGTVSAGTAQWRYDVAYVQCMYAKGNQVPAAPSAAQPSYTPPPPPNAPPPPPPAPPPSTSAPPVPQRAPLL